MRIDKNDWVVFLILFIIFNLITVVDVLGYEYLDAYLAGYLNVSYYWVWFAVICLALWWGYLKKKSLPKISKV